MLKEAVLFVVAAVAVRADVQCLDEDGNGVDWWFVYKMPNGFNYAYMDSNGAASKLAPFDDRTLDRIDGSLGSTLHQIYKAKKTLGYVMYNDQPPDEDKSTLQTAVNYLMGKAGLLKESKKGAHAKGVVATDGKTGFWLVHSVPKFPDLTGRDFKWTADDTYGQSFLCTSLDAGELDKVAIQLQHFHPSIFESNCPTKIADAIPSLDGLISGDRITGTSVEKLTSLGGQHFVSFAKDHDWNDDLYENLVQPTIKVDLYVETWRRGGVLPSFCGDRLTDYDTINVLNMQVGDVDFSYTHDHAKIAVESDDRRTVRNGYVCVGGINRMESQRKRGGGTVCFQHQKLWKALSASVTVVEECS